MNTLGQILFCAVRHIITMATPLRDDIVSVLADRYTTLRALIDHPQAKRELEDTLDCSRSTIDRAIRELRDANLIHYEDGMWTPTLHGWCAYHARNKYHNHLADLVEAAPVLDNLPLDSPVDCAMLEGVDVYKVNASVPDMVVETILDYVSGATSVRIITPVVLIGFAKRLCERVADSERYDVELTIPKDVFKQVHATYPDLTASFIDDENVQAYCASIPFSFGLLIVDDTNVGLLTFTDHGIGGFLMNDSEDAGAWAQKQYERVRRNADPMFSEVISNNDPTDH